MKKTPFRIGLNTIRNVCLDEWIKLWLEVNFDDQILLADVKEINESIQSQMNGMKIRIKPFLESLTVESNEENTK